MCDKTCLTNAELELTQKIQMHFPRGLNPEIVRAWNGCTKEVLTARLEEVFGKMPDRDESISSRWREQDGIIYFTLPATDGTTGEEWISRLEDKGFRIGDYAKSILQSKDFSPTIGVTNEVAVLKGMLFEDSNRTTKKVRAEADRRKFSKPNAEVACLIREMFTDKEIEAMGLWWIVAMHEPIKDSGGDPGLLCADRHDDGQWLYAIYGRPVTGGVGMVALLSSSRKLSALDSVS